ncbi:MAG: HIT family protein, partial [Anaerolineales bacterium]|nr:HIT family protein [Anaerolineales bacterium]MDW8162982.1 HIT family protein [Anaerolineales bacterium]
TESATAYALLDKYPVSPGHSLVIPKKHLSDYFDLSTHTKTALWIVVERVKDILKERFHPDGFNVGFNVGEAAGQTVPHVHLHIIPRYQGDVENPRGGIRHVIPSKGFYPKP